MKQLFIAWVPFQRRSISMQTHFDYELHFLSFSFKNRLLRPLEYAYKSLRTMGLFIMRRPAVIWVQLPPTPLLHLAFSYKLLSFGKVRIIADCHNATFRAPWIKIPGTVSLLERCVAVVVHSSQIDAQAKEIGIPRDRLYLLEDPTVSISADEQAPVPTFTHPWMLCPCSFNRDEPIKEVFAAARLAPEVTFVLTGNSNRAEGIHDLGDIPKNVELTGFLPVAEFNSLLTKTDAVLGLTKLDGIQLSAAVEATSAGIPMVLSDTPLLKTLFYKGAVHVNSDSGEAIAQGCRSALSNRAELSKQVKELQTERAQGWLQKAQQLSAALE